MVTQRRGEENSHVVPNVDKLADPGESIIAKWKMAKEADGRRNCSFAHDLRLPFLESGSPVDAGCQL